MTLIDIVLKILDIPKIEKDEKQKSAYELSNAIYHKTHKDGGDYPLKEFYMRRIKQKILYGKERTTLENTERMIKSIKVCNKKGHKENPVETYTTSNGTFSVCKRCHLGYEVKGDSAGSVSWYKSLTETFYRKF